MLALLKARDRENGRTRGKQRDVDRGACLWLILTILLVTEQGASGADTGNTGTADWPMWRYDAKRSASSPAPLPVHLHLRWVRQLPKPAPAWREEQYKLQFDRSYEPVVMGNQIFVPSMGSDKVVAYDTATGRQNWQFFCDGPVRFAPVAWEGRLYVASDDGYLYCLDARNGSLLWKLCLAPSGRKVLGNGRLISAWPARGGPVLYDGTIYCTASIWPFMGVFIYAVDARTGRVIWENSGTGAIYIQQQHGSPAFAGVAPQGYLASDGNKLLVTSRTTPACFDCATGELLYYPLSDRSYGKHVGGCGASIWNDWYFNERIVYRLSDGLALGDLSADVMSDDAVIGVGEGGCVLACQLAEEQKVNPKDKSTKTNLIAQPVWKAQTEPTLDRIHIRAGDCLYGSGARGVVAAVEVPDGNDPARIVWSDEVLGRVWSMLAGNGKLFVVTEEGGLYCFGEGVEALQHHAIATQDLPAASQGDRRRVRQILRRNVDPKGYCLWLGAGDGGLLMEAARQSQMQVIAIEPNAGNVAKLREVLDRAGLYGSRVSILHGRIDFNDLPPYVASLVVVESLEACGSGGDGSVIKKIHRLLRPYTGVAWVAADRGRQVALCTQVANADLPGVKVETTNGGVVVRRTGPVAGSADWTHQYGDVANTVCSKDQLMPPLGILWFGEEAGFGDVLPRHGHGPPEQIVGGRLFIQGIDSLSARDVYTGRVLWKKLLKPDAVFGVYYDASYKHDFRSLSYGQAHIPGANARGTDFVVTPDQVYVIQVDECLVLDPETGRTLRVLVLPGQEGQPRPQWTYLGVSGDYLLAGANFVRYSPSLKSSGTKSDAVSPFVDVSVSKALVVMNRYDGTVLWSVDADEGFIHNGIVAGEGKVFCLDAAPPFVRRSTQGNGARAKTRLLAMDLRTGHVVWENRDCAFGSWLSYSGEFGVLVQAHRKSSDMLWEPGDRMAAFRAKTGEILWGEKINYRGPVMVRGGTIFTQESAYDLLTGRQRTIPHPLTGEPVPWGYSRNYGCGTAVASENLLTFRSAAAGYYDLSNDGGTGNFGGFRSGCTSNLVVADGVLNAPDYTSTCTCSYQNQTSLAMVHTPEVEMWTFNAIARSSAAIRRAGINFGAPGDRRAENGTLWLDYPSVGGKSPGIGLTLTPKEPRWFRLHSLRLQGGDLRWVEASGAEGLRTVRVDVSGAGDADVNPAESADSDQGGTSIDRTYTVHLHFMEPENREVGERRFDVALNDRAVLKGFDIVAEARGARVGIVKTFRGIPASDSVTILLTPAKGSAETILCGVEIVAEQQANSQG